MVGERECETGKERKLLKYFIEQIPFVRIWSLIPLQNSKSQYGTLTSVIPPKVHGSRGIYVPASLIPCLMLILRTANSLVFLHAHVWTGKFPVAKEAIRQSCSCWQLDSELVSVEIVKLRLQEQDPNIVCYSPPLDCPGPLPPKFTAPSQ